MKKTCVSLIMAAMLLLISCALSVSARTIPTVDQNFDDGQYSFAQTDMNGSKAECYISDVESGGKALVVKQLSSYAHAGTPVKLKKDTVFSYSFDIKVLSYSDSSPLASDDRPRMNVNFLFNDENSTNKKMNHVIGGQKLGADGEWTRISGVYTPSSGVIAEDADLENAYFCVYIDPLNGKNFMFMIDNVLITYENNNPEPGVNFFKNGSFEDTETIEMVECNGTSAVLTPGNTDASDGIYSLMVRGNTPYAHVGIPIQIEPGSIYDFSYDIKIISDNKDNPVTSPIGVLTNFVFPDKNASGGRNHVIHGTNASSSDGWISISGSYTLDEDSAAPDADFENAWFSIYTNPFNNAGTVFLIDNIKLTIRPSGEIQQKLVLPDIISDNMLVQCGEDIHIWGTFSGGGSLEINLKDGENILSQAEAAVKDGYFDVHLPSVNEYINSAVMTFLCGDELVGEIKNVAVGELWHFSGQSNMAAGPSGDRAGEIVPENDMPDIRYFNAGDGGTGEWKTASKSNVYGMSAVAYKAMETIYNGLDSSASVGGINTSVGGKKMSDYTGTGSGGSLYNSRIKPITGIPVKGHMWYQGESDTKNANFVSEFEELIKSWRIAWNNPSAPFLFVQLPQSAATIPDWWGALDPNGNPTRTSTYDYTNVRFWQNELYEKMRNDGVSMVVSFDTTTEIEEQKSLENKSAEDPLHPWNKGPIGERLGNCALNTVYGLCEIEYQAPYPQEISVFGKYIAVKFDGVYNGIVSSDGNDIRFFEVYDESGTAHSPDMVKIISNDTILLSCDEIPNPSSVSYAYENHFVDMSKPFEGMKVNFFNSAGITAAPFLYKLQISDIKENFNDLLAPVHEENTDIKFGEHFGVRTYSNLSIGIRSMSAEYGYIVAKTSELNGEELTFNSNCKIISAAAYISDGSVDKHYTLSENKVCFTAVLTGIPEEGYEESLTVRPYIEFNNAGNTVVIYGNEKNISIKSTARDVFEKNADQLSEDQKELLQGIIDA